MMFVIGAFALAIVTFVVLRRTVMQPLRRSCVAYPANALRGITGDNLTMADGTR